MPQYFRTLLGLVAWIVASGWQGLWAADSGTAGEYLTHVWRKEDGLPHNSVTSILQTRDGYLWVGTLGGLARFDGVRFVTMGPKLAGMGANDCRVTGLCEDEQGNLWVGTDGQGVLRIYAGGKQILTTSQGLADNHVTAIFQQTNGIVWFGTQAGLSRWSQGTFQTLTVKDGLPHNRVTGLHAGPSGTLWISTQTGLCQYKNGQLSLCLLGMEATARGMGYFGVYEDREENLWTFGDTFLLNLSRGRRFNYFHSSAASLSRVWTLFETRMGELLVGTDSRGLIRFHDGNFTPVNLTGSSSILEIKAIAEDREGNLWIGTRGNGLCRLKRTRMVNYTMPEDYHGAHVTAVAENSKGELWLATQVGGLFYRGANQMEPRPLQIQGQPIDHINTLLTDLAGNLWLATWGHGLIRLDPLGVPTPFTLSSGLPDNVLTALALDGKGGIYVGSKEGAISHFDGVTFTRMPMAESRLGFPIAALVASTDGTLWHGSDGGGVGCFQTNGTHTCWTEKEGLASAHIRALHLDQKGRLWIGTDRPGLGCLVRGTLRNFSIEQGLPDLSVNQILEDREGNLWLGSNRGICRILLSELEALLEGRKNTVNVVVFDRDDGMVNLECVAGYCPSACRTADGRLWFPAAKGLVMVDPAAAPLNPVPPPVVIEQLFVDGVPIYEAPVYNPLKQAVAPLPLILRTAKQSMEFQFTALSLTTAEKVRFRYRLAEVDRQWIEATSLRKARYPRLTAGDYQFQVTACNNDGLWNPKPTIIAFTVLPPFWQTWWFIGMTIGGSIAMVTGGARYWMFRRLRRRVLLLEQQNALEKERSRIARDMHDAIGARLTQINFLCALVKQDLDRPAEARKDVDRMSGAARETIKGLEEIVWTVNPKNDSLDDLATYLSRYAQEFFRDVSMPCFLDIPTQLPAMHLSAEARHSLFLAFKEALNNIVKHAAASSVRIAISVETHHFTIAITDNGRGMTPNRESSPTGKGLPTGNGLPNMKVRMEAIGGNCRIERPPTGGTMVILEMPRL